MEKAMFPLARVPVLYLFHIACVIGIIALVVIWGQHPLTLLALNFLPDVPLRQDPEQVEADRSNRARARGRRRRLGNTDGLHMTAVGARLLARAH
jgi:hypothetical protein